MIKYNFLHFNLDPNNGYTPRSMLGSQNNAVIFIKLDTIYVQCAATTVLACLK